MPSKCLYPEIIYEMQKRDSPRIITTGNIPFNVEKGGLGKTLFEKMIQNGDAVAQIDGITGEKDTYSALLQRAVRTAIHMRNRGIARNDVISICSCNHINSIVPLFASFFIGALPANLDPGLSVESTVSLLEQVRPKMIFVDSGCVEIIEMSVKECELHTEIIVFGESKNHTEFSKILVCSDKEKQFKPVHANLRSTAIISFSSGTSGVPKAICLSHWTTLCQAMRLSLMGISMEGVLGYNTLYWNTTVSLATGCVINNGYRILVPTFDVNTIWKVLTKIKVTTLTLGSHRALLLSKHGRPKDLHTHLKVFILSGSYSSDQLVRDVEEMVPEAQVHIIYGLTEIGGSCIRSVTRCYKGEEIYKRRPASIGRGIEEFSFKVVDPDTEETLGPFQEGELRIKSSLVMNGYYNKNPHSAWDSDGWLKTGDVVYYDEDHRFYVTDRMKELIKFQGTKVSPCFLEGILNSHPSVETAVVVGMPHPTDINHPLGVVVLKRDVMDTSSDIVKYVDSRVEDYKRLRAGVKIVSCIPITGSGKINRHQIKEMVIDGKI